MHRFLIAEYVPISALCHLLPGCSSPHRSREFVSGLQAALIETVDGDPITLRNTLHFILFLVRIAVAAPLRRIDQYG